MNKIVLSALLLASVWACSPKANVNAGKKADAKAQMRADSIAASKAAADAAQAAAEAKTVALYETQCSKCHKPKPIGNFTETQWKKIMPNMAKKAGVSAAEEAELTAYVLKNCKQE